jgi:hypothetical protein
MTNRKQELALAAALLPVELALVKWKELVAISSIEDFEHSVTRALPLVYLNCKEELTGNDLLKLKGSYRHSWARNTEMFMQLQPVLRKLQDEGVDYRLLKGGALNILAGPPGARIMGDIDLLINKSDLNLLQNLLIGLDFKRMFSYGCEHKSSKAKRLELNFVNEDSLEIDIHIAQERSSRRLFEIMMKSRPEVREFSGISVKMPEDCQLIAHSLIHGHQNVQDEDESQMIMDIYQLLNQRNAEKTFQLTNRLGIFPLLENYFTTISRIQLPGNFTNLYKKQFSLKKHHLLQDRLYSALNGSRSLFRAIWYRTPNLTNIWRILRSQKVNKILYLLWAYTGMLRPLEYQIIRQFNGFTKYNPQSIHARNLTLNQTSEWSNDWRFGFSRDMQKQSMRIRALSNGFVNQSFLVFMNGKLITVTENSIDGEFILELRELRDWNEISFRLPFSGCKICSQSLRDITLEILD